MSDAPPRPYHGRVAGTPNRDKAELRALIQERVHEFTELRRNADLASGMEPDEAQSIVENYDPVVQLSMFAVDRRSSRDQQMTAASQVAQYVRPKLKAVELTADPEALETLEQRRVLTDRLVGLLEAAAAAKKQAPVAEEPSA